MSWTPRPLVQQLHDSRVPVHTTPPRRHTSRLMTYHGSEPAFEDDAVPPPSHLAQNAHSSFVPPLSNVYSGGGGAAAPPTRVPTQTFQPYQQPTHHPFSAPVSHFQPPPPPLSHPPPPTQHQSTPLARSMWKQKYMRARMEQQQKQQPAARPVESYASRPTGLGHARGCSTCTAPKIK